MKQKQPASRPGSGYERIEMTGDDIYSQSSTDIYSTSDHRPQNAGRKKKKHRLLKSVAVLAAVLLTVGAIFYCYAYSLVDRVERQPLDRDDLGITTARYDGVKNIALLGIDTHEDNDSGRSDAVVIMTIDRKHNKLKLTSVARDTYVAIEGHGQDKLTHAYAYGKSQLAVKTLNQNLGVEIEDYITVNFFEFARIIDYAGGVTVEVDEDERQEMNTNIIPYLVEMGIDCEPVEAAGVQLLSGGQAVCYARIRHTDNDIERGNRQKEVLMSLLSQVRRMNPLRLPHFAEMVVSECQTSLPTDELLSIGIWAALRSPDFEQLSLPNDHISSAGRTIGGVWYYVYDLDDAAQEIYDFVFEEGAYDPKQQ